MHHENLHMRGNKSQEIIYLICNLPLFANNVFVIGDWYTGASVAPVATVSQGIRSLIAM